jgi:hypothetical protein
LELACEHSGRNGVDLRKRRSEVGGEIRDLAEFHIPVSVLLANATTARPRIDPNWVHQSWQGNFVRNSAIDPFLAKVCMPQKPTFESQLTDQRRPMAASSSSERSRKS